MENIIYNNDNIYVVGRHPIESKGHIYPNTSNGYKIFDIYLTAVGADDINEPEGITHGEGTHIGLAYRDDKMLRIVSINNVIMDEVPNMTDIISCFKKISHRRFLFEKPHMDYDILSKALTKPQLDFYDKMISIHKTAEGMSGYNFVGRLSDTDLDINTIAHPMKLLWAYGINIELTEDNKVVLTVV